MAPALERLAGSWPRRRSTPYRRFCAASLVVLVILSFGGPVRASEFRGHGGPVRAISVGADGATAITGSFDGSAIIWSLQTGAARQVLQFHAGQVTSVLALPEGRFATAGDDGRIAIWREGEDTPTDVLEGHTAPVAALAISPDGAQLASASWDATVRLWPLGGGEPAVLDRHRGNVNAVAFMPDGRIASGGYDNLLIVWPTAAGGAPLQVTMASPINALAALADGRLAAGFADGHIRILAASGEVVADASIAPTPVIAIAASIDGRYLAAAGIKGAVSLLDPVDLSVERTLVGPGLPVWSLAFTSGSATLLTGGSDGAVHRWTAATGEHLGPVAASAADPVAAYAGDRGAEVFRACVACHSLGPGEPPKAGPTLHGLFGRKIASVPGYRYSDAFRSMDIVWTPETVSELFRVGPHAFTPGTRMPEQTIGSDTDRRALVQFLQRATRPE